MRKFTDGSNGDTTLTVQAYLETASEPLIYTLVVIQLARWVTNPSVATPGDPLFTAKFLLTNYPAAVKYTPLGVFNAANIKHNSISFQVGLEMQPFEVVWTPAPGESVLPAQSVALLGAFPSISVLSGVDQGFFDGAYISVYKTVMPTPGDANTYGVTLLQRGVVDTASVNGQEITFSCVDPIAHANNQIPSQLVGPNSRFSAVDPILYSASDLFAEGVAYKGYGPQKIHFLSTSFIISPGSGYLDGGVFIWTTGALNGMSRTIRSSVYNAGFFDLYLTQPFPFDPNDFAPGYLLGLSAAVAPLRPSTSADAHYNGFKNVPVPLDTA
jgi:hypothetical protein